VTKTKNVIMMLYQFKDFEPILKNPQALFKF